MIVTSELAQAELNKHEYATKKKITKCCELAIKLECHGHPSQQISGPGYRAIISESNSDSESYYYLYFHRLYALSHDYFRLFPIISDYLIAKTQTVTIMIIP